MEKTTTRFNEVKLLIHQTCQKFRKQYGGDYDDLFSLAQEVFLITCQDYDETKGAKFSTYLRNMIWFRLQDRNRKIQNRLSILPKTDSRELDNVKVLIIDEFDMLEFLSRSNLSAKAKTVIQIALENKTVPASMRNGQAAIRKILMKDGWKSAECSDVFEEIKEALSND